MQRREFLLGTLWSSSLLSVPAWTRNAPVEAGVATTVDQIRGSMPPSHPVLSTVLELDQGWCFHAGDIAFPELTGQDETYDNAKAGKAWGAAATDFDDSEWRRVRLPHDYAVEQPVEADANIAQGYRRRGIAWYRRTLRLEQADRGKSLELRFDGISSHATVWVNGLVMARNWSGYNGFAIDLTPIARYGQDLNTIAVRVDAKAMDGWWYEGAGIYRHVWLMRRVPLHIVSDGLAAVPREGRDDLWTLPVQLTLANAGEQPATARVQVVLFDPQGQVVTQGSSTTTVAALEQVAENITLQLRSPQRWDVQKPALYRLHVRIDDGSGRADEQVCEIGFRSLRFDAERGFFLNGKSLKIKGACLHQDHAGVGVALPDSLHEFRIRRLKSMGCNAIRLHHAVAAELLQVCDRLGMLVMAENRIFNPSPEYLSQLQWMVRRDRNHPSVFMWSVLNEEPMQGTAAGYQMVRRAVAAVKALDDSRPVTAAMNDGMLSVRNAADAVDVLGFNYRQFNYDRVHAARPLLPMLSSEDTSAFQTRGAWTTDLQAHVIAEDDSMAAEWGNTHRRSWQLIAERDFIAGGFVWTGFDYRGEPTPFAWPSVASFFGIMDQCGFAKGAYWLRRALWIEHAPVLHLLPHWNWPGREGQPINVMAFCNAQQVELWHNGRSRGRQAVSRWQSNQWSVPYVPGVLEAVAWDAGREVARARVETTGKAVALRLLPDRARMFGDGRDAQPVTIEALDAQGRHVADAQALVSLQIDGGRLLGVGNGDPNSHAPEHSDRIRLFNGLAQAIVQTDSAADRLQLDASAAGLRSASLSIVLQPVALPAMVAEVAPALVIGGWRCTAAFSQPPPADLPRKANDNNSWSFTQPGTLETAAERSGYVLYRSVFTPWSRMQQRGGVLRLGRLTGKAVIYLDGHEVAHAPAGVAINVPLAAGSSSRVLAVVLRVEAGQAFGFHDVVIAEYQEPA
jgi:beta-galactosidase